MSDAVNLRIDPRTGEKNWTDPITEEWTVAEFEELPGVFGILLDQVPHPTEIEVYRALDPSVPLTRVQTVTEPEADQFWSDSQQLNPRGYIIVNSTLYAEGLIIVYRGGGYLAHKRNLEDVIPVGPPGPPGGVDTVFGRSGDVVADAADYAAFYDGLGDATAAQAAAVQRANHTGTDSAASINAMIPLLHPHGIFNTKFTAVNNSTTEQSLGVDLSVASYDIICAIRKAGASGDVEWLSSSSAIKITLSTGTVTGTIAGVNVTGAYDLYAYAISDNGTLIFGLSRSPYHKSVPANYAHTNTASARTLVGSASTAWDAMWISKAGTINATNSCVCLGLAGTVTFDATNGRASVSTLASGAVPAWDSQPDTNPQPYLPTLTGFGAATSITGSVWYSARGKMGHFEYTWTTETCTSTEARASTPFTSAANYPTLQIIGSMTRKTQSGVLVPLVEASKAYIVFGTPSLAGGLNKANGNAVDEVNNQVLSVCGSVRLA